MVLTEKQENKIKEMPIMESKIVRSKDGKYLLHKTTITTIRPMSYYEAVIANNVKVDEENLAEEVQNFLEA